MDSAYNNKILLISLQEDLETIGLKMVHYALIANDFASTLLFSPYFNEASISNIIAQIEELRPSFIGFSLMTVEHDKVQRLATAIKKRFPDIPLLFGGIHPTIDPEGCLQYCDYVMVGEGEQAIVDFAHAINGKGNPKHVRNIYHLENGELVKNDLYEPNNYLDDLVPYDHIPKASLLQVRQNNIVSLSEQVFRKNTRYRGTTCAVISSRGCPFSCSYCCNSYLKDFHGRKVRRRSVDNIINELVTAVKKHPFIETFNFQDDCFMSASPKYLEDFCRKYKTHVGKPFVVRGIPIYVTSKKIKILKDAGLAWICVGLQSGSEKTNREIYNRKSTSKDFLRATKIIDQEGVAGFYDVILDNPFETENDVLETIKTILETPRPFYSQLFSLTFYEGTEITNRARREIPQSLNDPKKKNYLRYVDKPINTLVAIASTLPVPIVKWLVKKYEADPKNRTTNLIINLLKYLSLFIFEPIACFRVIRISQRGSIMSTFRTIRAYLKEGLKRFDLHIERQSNPHPNQRPLQEKS